MDLGALTVVLEFCGERQTAEPIVNLIQRPSGRSQGRKQGHACEESLDVKHNGLVRRETRDSPTVSGSCCARPSRPTSSAPPEFHETVFGVKNEGVLQGALEMAKRLRAKKKFTNTATFDLKCEVRAAPP